MFCSSNSLLHVVNTRVYTKVNTRGNTRGKTIVLNSFNSFNSFNSYINQYLNDEPPRNSRSREVGGIWSSGMGRM